MCDYYNGNPRHRQKFEAQLLWLAYSLYINLEQRISSNQDSSTLMNFIYLSNIVIIIIKWSLSNNCIIFEEMPASIQDFTIAKAVLHGDA